MKEQIQKFKIIGISFLVGLATMLLLVMIYSGGADNTLNSKNHILETSAEKTQYYTCSMHPQIKLLEEGACPICGMDLIPLSLDLNSKDNEAILTLSNTAKKLAQIQTVAVEKKYVESTVRMVGKVEYDETKLFSITSWVSGRIERLFVDYTGILIEKGDHMVKIYSSELLSAQEEYLQAIKSIQDVSSTDLAIMKETSRNTLISAREKLKLLGIGEKQIKELEKSGEASNYMIIYAPIGGIVVSKSVKEGAYVKTGDTIYQIADLSKVWLKLDVYETDINLLRYGQKVIFSTESSPGETFEGKISFIDPILNDKTRTIKIRVNVDNISGKLKPGMFVQATVLVKLSEAGVVVDTDLAGKWICPMHPEIIKNESGKCDICTMPLKSAKELGYLLGSEPNIEAPLVIPITAPLITGKRAVVYVAEERDDETIYEGREVVLGTRAGDYYIVKEGLVEGEMVVVNGNFKIDSALQIKAKPSMMSPAKEVISHTDKKSMENLSDVPAEFAQSLSLIYDAYFSFQNALATDDFNKAKDSLDLLESNLAEIDMRLLKDRKQHTLWRELSEKIKQSLQHKKHIKNIADIRKMILQDLSKTIIALSKAFGRGFFNHFEMFCPMAGGGKGATWMQDNTEVSNPYYGQSMLRCGEVKSVLGVSKEEQNTHE